MIEDILRKLSGVKKTRSGWMAKCPAHKDSNVSLSVGEGPGGKLLLHCFAGCSYEAVAGALGLGLRFSAPAGGPPPRRRPSEPPPAPSLPPETIGRLWATWAASTTDAKIAEIAGELGVSPEALRAVGAAWEWQAEAVAFPMFDGNGEFRGIRMRAMDGKKWSVTGGKEGIFTGSMPSEPFCIVEGPTDLAALYTLGFCGLGRPSCQGAIADTVEYCKLHGIKQPIILSDNDGPGQAGARELQRMLPGSKVAMLPAKDIREWVREGATKEMVESCIRAK